MSSPGGKAGTPGRRKNLTGSARHVRDLAADIHANIQKWNRLHLQGFEILKSVVEVRSIDSSKERLQDLCNELELIYDSLNDVVRSLGEISRQMSVLTSMRTCPDNLFDAWTVKRNDLTVQKIHEAYLAELLVKRNVIENVAHSSTENSGMLYLASWAAQPLMPHNSNFLVEALLTGTEHRLSGKN